jgi:hypothetical protein
MSLLPASPGLDIAGAAGQFHAACATAGLMGVDTWGGFALFLLAPHLLCPGAPSLLSLNPIFWLRILCPGQPFLFETWLTAAGLQLPFAAFSFTSAAAAPALPAPTTTSSAFVGPKSWKLPDTFEWVVENATLENLANSSADLALHLQATPCATPTVIFLFVGACGLLALLLPHAGRLARLWLRLQLLGWSISAALPGIAQTLGLPLASFLLGLKILGVFILLILIRITVPRFKVETLSRLAWAVLLVILLILLLWSIIGGFFG